MHSKQLQKAFKKMLHGDIKEQLDFTIEDWNKETGWIVFVDNFEDIFRCSPKMMQVLQWYLTNPKLRHAQAKNSESGYDRGISLMDKNTGARHIEDYANDKDKFVQKIYQLRKKYQ
jgi:hypothetical protein